MEEKELGIQLINSVLEFASKMNELERDIVEKDEKNPEKDHFKEYKDKYLPIFHKYCTDKKRAYGGKADSYGTPTHYDGIEKAIDQKVVFKTKNRAEVYFKTNNDFDAEYLFVVLRKNETWKVDNVKYKWFGSDKWKPKIL